MRRPKLQLQCTPPEIVLAKMLSISIVIVTILIIDKNEIYWLVYLIKTGHNNGIIKFVSYTSNQKALTHRIDQLNLSMSARKPRIVSKPDLGYWYVLRRPLQGKRATLRHGCCTYYTIITIVL